MTQAKEKFTTFEEYLSYSDITLDEVIVSVEFAGLELKVGQIFATGI